MEDEIEEEEEQEVGFFDGMELGRYLGNRS
jgi:hypothetical protein